MNSNNIRMAERGPRLERVLMRVRGMQDVRCAASVTSALQLIGGVMQAEVSLLRGEAEILFDPSKAEPGQFHTAVRAVGFQPAFIEDTQAAA